MTPIWIVIKNARNEFNKYKTSWQKISKLQLTKICSNLTFCDIDILCVLTVNFYFLEYFLFLLPLI